MACSESSVKRGKKMKIISEMERCLPGTQTDNIMRKKRSRSPGDGEGMELRRRDATGALGGLQVKRSFLEHGKHTDVLPRHSIDFRPTNYYSSKTVGK